MSSEQYDTGTPARYTRFAKFLHWGFAIAILGQFALYQLMHNLAVSPLKWQFYDLHKSIGITLLGLIFLRLFWRWLNPPPPLPAAMPAWQQKAANASHRLLYLVMITMPISGIIGSKAGGFKATWFGLYEMPDIFGKNDSINFWAESAHMGTFYLLAALVALHASAAFYHHFKLKDDTLMRMIRR